eukprot:TRINITY_DN12561_c0_g1_i1.p2 TRINITY_DN12561_c0_g1~~TRINITY_DN12561_c0_g1_i1.p2  ORF type:complete len:177 (-),score=1.83 TRINITY_DN12561_c0_g1_i1:464-994(-)
MGGKVKEGVHPYSSALITRVADGAAFTALGSSNDYFNKVPAPSGGNGTTSLLRAVTASLLAGFTYLVTLQPSPLPPFFLPSSLQLRLLDVGGCQGNLTVLLAAPNATVQWRVTSGNKESPCVGSPRAPSSTTYRTACVKNQPVLALDVGPTAVRTVAQVELGSRGSAASTCPVTQC